MVFRGLMFMTIDYDHMTDEKSSDESHEERVRPPIETRILEYLSYKALAYAITGDDERSERLRSIIKGYNLNE